MAKAYLKLVKEDGTVMEFRKEKIKAHWVKELFKLQKKLREECTEDITKAIDERIDFAVRLFGDKELTAELILDCLDSDELIPTLGRIEDSIMGGSKEDTGGK